MSAEIIHLHTAIHEPAKRVCWFCVVMWTSALALQALAIALFALVLA